MKSGYSPEITVLLHGCAVEISEDKKSQLTRFLTHHSLDWERLYTLANWHRLTPFLYQTLQYISGIPENFLAKLRNDCQLSAIDTLLKQREYHQVTELLTTHGIAHVTYKGVYLAENFYPNTSLRICGDIDILVGKEEAPKAIRLLQSHQYHLNQLHTSYWSHNEYSLLDDLPEVSLFKPFFGNNNQFDIDLHWSIVCFNKHYKSFTLSDFQAHSDFSAELQVILLVTHHGVTDLWQRIFYINDLYFLLKDKMIDWTWLLQKLQLYGLEKTFLVGLHWCQQIWNLPLPPFVQALLKASNVRSIAGAYEKNWEVSHSIKGSNLVLTQLMFFTKAQTHLRQLVKIYFTFFTSRVFRASTFRFGEHLLYIPQELGVITIFIRATRSIYNFFFKEPHGSGRPSKSHGTPSRPVGRTFRFGSEPNQRAK
jgi:Uncharacterised nucleotidyltransferase